MRLLFTMDAENYDLDCGIYSRPSVRGIILRGDRIAMVHSLKYDYYKFPGGGLEKGESQREALIREVREEAGLRVIPGSVREYGYVHRFQRGRKYGKDVLFIQENFYYFCQVEQEIRSQHLDRYEAEERFTLEFTTPERVISTNFRPGGHGPKSRTMLEREAKVLELLLDEGYFGSPQVVNNHQK